MSSRNGCMYYNWKTTTTTLASLTTLVIDWTNTSIIVAPNGPNCINHYQWYILDPMYRLRWRTRSHQSTNESLVLHTSEEDFTATFVVQTNDTRSTKDDLPRQIKQFNKPIGEWPAGTQAPQGGVEGLAPTCFIRVVTYDCRQAQTSWACQNARPIIRAIFWISRHFLNYWPR